MKLPLTFCALLLSVALIPTAKAVLIVNIIEVGNNVEVVATGSVDLTGAPAPSGFNLSGAGVQDAAGDIVVSGSVLADAYFGIFTSPPGPLGTWGLTFANGGESGSALAVLSSTSTLVLPQNYNSGEPINASSTYLNHTVQTLGLVPGSYPGTLVSGDTVTLNIVPEPSRTLLALGGLCIALFVRRRSHKF
ncbi:MAG: hypothetical protein AAF591_19915 [Verrucomicrobiota bacterium]